MKYPKAIALLAVAVLLSACSSPGQFSRIEVGMTKSEVISILGDPFTQKAQGNMVYLVYRDYNHPLASSNNRYNPQRFVRLIDGRVESYGEVGDFDSTKDPTVNVNIKNR